MKYVVIASGASLTDDDVEYVRSCKEQGKIDGVLAVSDVGLEKAPWADALVSHDSTWWQAHPEALDFSGDKFSRQGYRGTKNHVPTVSGGCNSGLMAMEIARDIYKATLIILLGFDMHGTHFFGPHTAKYGNLVLRNTTHRRFQAHLMQFNFWRGCEVINCTPGSALKKFHTAELRDII